MDRLDPPVADRTAPQPSRRTTVGTAGRDRLVVALLALTGAIVALLVLDRLPLPSATRVAGTASGTFWAIVLLVCWRMRSPDGDRRVDRLRPFFVATAGLQVARYAVQAVTAPGPAPLVEPAPLTLFLLTGLGVVATVTALPLPPADPNAMRRARSGAAAVAVALAVGCWAASDAGMLPVGSGPTLLAQVGIVAAAGFAVARLGLVVRPPVRSLAPGLAWVGGYVATSTASGLALRDPAHPGRYLALDVVAQAGQLLVLLLHRDRPDPRDDVRDEVPPGVAGWDRLPPWALAVLFATLALTQTGQVSPQRVLVATVGTGLGTLLLLRCLRASLAGQERELHRLRADLAVRDAQTRDLQRHAFEDALTGTANRAQFTTHLADAQREAARMGTSLALLLIDLDDFKPVNDRYGHAAGDVVLRTCADRVAAALRPGDLLARLGGDEFAVVLHQSYKLSASAVAEQIVSELRRPIVISSQVTTRINVSVGIAADTGGRRTPESLLRSADMAMYTAKERGKGTVALAPDATR